MIEKILYMIISTEGLTIIALIAGPVLAVLITRWLDNRRDKKSRRWQIFRDLMCFRTHPTSQGFVTALNLIEVEFYDDWEVLNALKNLLEHYNKQEPQGQGLLQTHLREAEELRTLLIKEVALALGIELDSLDILGKGYYPVAWANLEDHEATMRHLLSDIMRGNRSFPVHIVEPPMNQTASQLTESSSTEPK